MFFPTRKVKCPDGRRIRVYRRADDAFPVVASSASISIGATLEAAGLLEGGLHGGAHKEIQEVATRLDVINRSLRERLRAAYVVYQAEPCSKGDYLAEEVRRISEQEERLREVAFSLDNLVRLQASGAPDASMLALLIKVMERLDSGPQVERGTATTIEQNMERWQRGLA